MVESKKEVAAGSITIMEDDQEYFLINVCQQGNYQVSSYSGLNDSGDPKTGNAMQSNGFHWMADAAYNQSK